MCIFPTTVIHLASEVIAASKQPRMSHLTSYLNSVASKTYAPAHGSLASKYCHRINLARETNMIH